MPAEAIADPFPHCVIEEAFPPCLLRDCLATVPPASWPAWVRYDNSLERGKRTTRDLFRLPPVWSDLFALLAHPGYIALLGRSLGVGGLEFDDTLHGAGLHVLDPGGRLAPHLDYALHPHLAGRERRANVVLFLNPEWRPEWGGALQLCDGLGTPVRSIFPSFGRAVFFRCDDDSFHAVAPTVPDAPPRVTAAAYYLAPARPTARRMRAMFFPDRGGPLPALPPDPLPG